MNSKDASSAPPEMAGSPQRVAVVSGAAAGIGNAIARRLSAAGLHTVVADIREAQAEEAARGIRQTGGLAAAMFVDVSSATSITEFFERLRNSFGRCDVLVNNAGIIKLTAFMELPFDVWNSTMAVNLTGPLLMAQHAVPLMLLNNWGRIVNIASISGLRASVGRTAYGTSKAALTGLTRQMAIELATSNITVNAVAPGPIETDMTAAAHSERTSNAYHSMVPMRRYGRPDEIASAVNFLCSDEAAYITGHTLPVDGGYLAAGVLEV
jgi:3-oxoacyl-[acyl-carrier protein] reductase